MKFDMARLTAEIKVFMLQQNACFDQPSAVVKAVQEEFGVTVTRQTVESYDPTKATGRGLAQKWQDIFWDTRKKFLDDTSQISLAHKSVRLRMLDKAAKKAEQHGNTGLLLQVLEQAAKETGDAYTNRRQHEHFNPDGSLKPPPATPVQVIVDSGVAKSLAEKLTE